MKSTDELTREIGALRKRISDLSGAVLRISASLDVDTVLKEIAENARALTGARAAVITALDDAGRVDYVTSGLTVDEERELIAWPDGLRLFEHLRNLSSPLRVSDLRGYVRSLGFPSEVIFVDTFLGTSIRHRNVQAGSFFLGEKEGGQEFTKEDEEVLVMFAAQAATAIANARTHRAEQRVRADLEALINTSPVGVVVFDARTARLVSINREARRIVAGLLDPGQTEEELLQVLTFRLADGQEVSLNEFPLATVLSNAATVRAEEVVLSVRDGRSVTVLINATPIKFEGDAVQSLVVTMQDLGPLEELERQRAEFLGMVSHELRAPLSSVKGLAATALGNSRVADPAEVRQFFRIIEQQADHMDGLIRDLLDVGRIDTGTLSVDPEPVEVTALVDQARSTFLSGGARHVLNIDLPVELPPVMADKRRIVQVLNNLFSNAAQHSPESCPIRVEAVHDGAEVAISVSDEGSGVTPDRLRHLFRKHTVVDDRGARRRGAGLGLAICKGLVEAHGGRIRAESPGPDRGTRFTFTLPVVDEVGDGASPLRSRLTRDGRTRTGILVVDDDPLTLHYVRDALTAAGYAPTVTGDPREALRLITTRRPQLLVLDLVLPGMDGIELMESIPEMADIPVIFLSAYGREETIARALEAGAADYIVKPFSPTELTARVRAALRKRTKPDPFVVAELAIDYQKRHVTVAGRPVRLTATEYELLRVLSVNAGRVLTYESLVRQIWGQREDTEPVRTFVKKLRGKLGDNPGKPTYIFNERGVGYRMAAPGDE
ncbi:MAG: response regulator [Spirochaetaceae bacterium]|nr:response regulator [Spirochaetaceae bacterium]